MCGIIGLFSKQRPIAESPLRQGVKHLRHRGPDGNNIWISPSRQVGLGHTLHGITDPTGGEQPITNRDETLHVIVNGEFYDYERIQRNLKARGYQFKTESDSEVALHLYAEFGTQCLHHLRGEFAFIIWDERNESIFAARDRFGICPLYYALYNDTLYLASEVKALFAAGVPARWDHESFFLLNAGVLLPNRTLFANVYQVPPGCFLMSSGASVDIHRYWDFDYPRESDVHVRNPLSEHEYVEGLREKLDEAIRLRLTTKVQVGCYLSGGIDSSTVLGLASMHSPHSLKAFTIAFDHDAYNEESLARKIAAHTGANLHIIPIQQSDLAQHFADAVYHCETLCRNGGPIAKYLLSRAARNSGCKVVLTGEGSDEIFGGYEELQIYDHASADFSFAEDGLARTLNGLQRILGFVPIWMGVLVKRFSQDLHLYSSEFISQFDQRDVYRMLLDRTDVQGQLSGREPIHQSMYLWSKTALANYLLRALGDGVERAHSLEGRLPFLDHHVVEFARDIPAHLKIRGTTEKYVLREAARPFVIDEVYASPKRPFLAPPCTLRPNEALYQLLQDTLRGSTLPSLPFYNQAAVINFLDQIPHMSRNDLYATEQALMKMMSACILQERFGLT